MKVEYKNIIGICNKDSDNCLDCCFYNLMYCIPFDIHHCYDQIFEYGVTQIFDL